MNTLIFATNNLHKIDEVRKVLDKNFELITLQEAGIQVNIPEPHATLEDNAREKSMTIFQLTGINCFSEDTGLEVAALQGAPGVKSARYAGESCSFEDNIDRLLKELAGIKNRKARFRTIISLMENGREKQFEGICEGQIAMHKTGTQGFGYDSVFIPDGSSDSFATMTLEEKNTFSHRRKAMDLLLAYLHEKAIT